MNTEEHKETILPIDQVINLPKVKDMIPSIQENLLSGNYSPLKAHLFFGKVAKISEKLYEGDIGKKLKEQINEEIRANKDGKSTNLYNVRITEQDRAFYKFDECQDPIWDELDKIEKQVKELKKTREAELKLCIPKPGFGLPETKIAVNYFPKFELEDNTDLAIINPPIKGAKTIFMHYY